MKRERAEAGDAEPHVFDQTNGVVDLGANGPDSGGGETGKPDARTVAGMAMLSTTRP